MLGGGRLQHHLVASPASPPRLSLMAGFLHGKAHLHGLLSTLLSLLVQLNLFIRLSLLNVVARLRLEF